jgi:hypothetical protein
MAEVLQLDELHEVGRGVFGAQSPELGSQMSR